jgi:hypothetical protein
MRRMILGCLCVVVILLFCIGTREVQGKSKAAPQTLPCFDKTKPIKVDRTNTEDGVDPAQETVTICTRDVVIWDRLRIPDHADQRSDRMPIIGSGPWRSGFRTMAITDSGLIPIS